MLHTSKVNILPTRNKSTHTLEAKFTNKYKVMFKGL